MPASTQGSSFDQLKISAEKGDSASFSQTLNSCDPPLNQDELNQLLFIACSSLKQEIVEILLGKGADINAHQRSERERPGRASRANASPSFPLAMALSSNAPLDFISFHSLFFIFVIDYEEITYLLSKSPNQASKDGALFYAASHGKLAELQVLLQHGAVVESEGQATTPLYAASLRGFTDVMRVLLDKSANPNSKNDQGNTPLHAIVSKPGDDGSNGLEILVAAGADLNAQNNQGDTPLIKAVRQNNINSVKSLISKLQEKGLNLHVPNKKGGIHESAVWSSIPLMQVFFEQGATDPNFPDAEGNTALHLTTSQKSNVEQARFLLMRGANPNVKNSAGDTPVHKTGSVEIAEALLEKDADVTVQNNEGLTPVMVAIKANKYAIATAFVMKNMDQSGVAPILSNLGNKLQLADLDGRGNSLLHLAVESPELVKCFFASDNQGAKNLVNCKNSEGETALHTACRADSWQIANLLLDNGVDAKSKNNEQQTAFDVALASGSIYCLIALLEANIQGITSSELDEWKDEDGNSLLHKAVSCGYTHGIEVLSKLGANINISNSTEDAYVDGGAPLHFAAMRGEVSCLNTLLDCGADINSTESYDKNTPLHLACYHQQPKCVEVLLERGADHSILNEAEESALQNAQMANSVECINILKRYIK